MMKTIRHILSIALILCANGAGFEARACGVSLSLCVPFVSLGIGFGLGGHCGGPAIGFGIGASCAGPAYGCAYGYPGCAYPQPAYASDPPANYALAATASPAPAAPPVAETPAWVPSTPGAGHWVPDPEPYSYTPGPTVKRTSAVSAGTPQTVTVSRSAGGVPVYSVNR